MLQIVLGHLGKVWALPWIVQMLLITSLAARYQTVLRFGAPPVMPQWLSFPMEVVPSFILGSTSSTQVLLVPRHQILGWQESTEAVSSTKVTGLDLFVLTTCKKETLGWDSHIRLESPEVFLYKRMMIWLFSCVIFVWLFGIDLISFLQWIDWCCYTIIKSWFNARWRSWRGVW